MGNNIKIRSGIGYDIHRVQPGNGLVIGGINVSDNLSFISHSDGDILIHALIDSLLGAIGEQDIGEHFPDTDDKYKNIDSSALLKRTLELVKQKEFEIINIDSVIIAESPKLQPFKMNIRKNVSKLLDIPFEDFNVKAKTKEKVDSVGRGEAIECYCIVMVRNCI